MNWQLFYTIVCGVFFMGFTDFYVSRQRPPVMSNKLWWGLLGLSVLAYSTLYWGGILALSNAGWL